MCVDVRGTRALAYPRGSVSGAAYRDAPLWAMHASIDLVRAPLRYYEAMPSLVMRRMGGAEALIFFGTVLAQLLTASPAYSAGASCSRT